jgi:hypothetical protein
MNTNMPHDLHRRSYRHPHRSLCPRQRPGDRVSPWTRPPTGRVPVYCVCPTPRLSWH